MAGRSPRAVRERVSRPGTIKTPRASDCRTRWICCCIQQRHQRIDIGPSDPQYSCCQMWGWMEYRLAMSPPFSSRCRSPEETPDYAESASRKRALNEGVASSLGMTRNSAWRQIISTHGQCVFRAQCPTTDSGRKVLSGPRSVLQSQTGIVRSMVPTFSKVGRARAESLRKTPSPSSGFPMRASRSRLRRKTRNSLPRTSASRISPLTHEHARLPVPRFARVGGAEPDSNGDRLG